MTIEVKDVPVYTSIPSAVHGKDLSQLRGQRIFLLLSSKYLEPPSIHALSNHFHQATEHSPVEVSIFYVLDVLAARIGDNSIRQCSNPYNKLFILHRITICSTILQRLLQFHNLTHLPTILQLHGQWRETNPQRHDEIKSPTWLKINIHITHQRGSK